MIIDGHWTDDGWGMGGGSEGITTPAGHESCATSMKLLQLHVDEEASSSFLRSIKLLSGNQSLADDALRLGNEDLVGDEELRRGATAVVEAMGDDGTEVGRTTSSGS